MESITIQNNNAKIERYLNKIILAININEREIMQFKFANNLQETVAAIDKREKLQAKFSGAAAVAEITTGIIYQYYKDQTTKEYSLSYSPTINASES